MKYRLLFIFMIFSFIPTFAEGEQLWYSGFNGNITATGYGGLAVKDSYNFLNPAANAENIRLFSSGNISSDGWGGSFGISTPVELGGIFFAGTQHLNFDDTYLVNVGYGKNVQSELAFGLEGLLSIHPNVTSGVIGGGFRMGFLWSPDFHIENNWGFGDFSLGAVWKMLVHPTGETCNNPTPEMLWQVGIDATIMKYSQARWKFILDYSVGFVPFGEDIYFQTWASLGTTFTFWDIWDISAGTILGNNGLGFGDNQVLPYTVGTSIHHEWDSFSAKIAYSFGGQKFFDQPEYIHTVALELGIGQKPSTNRAAVLTTKNHQQLTNYFSPNEDLMLDTVVFQSHIMGKNINGWELVIVNSRGAVVRTFKEDETKADSKVGAFVYNYFMPTRSLYIPNQIVWDGKDNQCEYVPEGVYRAMLTAKYDENKQISSEINTIIVDTTKPSGIINIREPYVFLGDDPTSVLKIGQTLSSNDPWTAKLVDNADNKVVAQWFWKKGEVPTFIEWQLDNPKRINVGYGKFSYIASSFDQAGNYTEERFTNITIETRKRNPRITINKSKFSPANGDTVTITPKYGVTTGLTNSILSVYDQSGKKVHSIPQNVTNLSKEIVWNGTDNNKKIVGDGLYIVALEQYYIDKEQFDSPPLLVEVDTTPPLFRTDITPRRFSPDGDNINDALKIDFTVLDAHDLAKWTISILNNDDVVLCRFQGRDSEKSFFWYPNKRLSSGELLYFNIEICDDLGNKLETIFHELRVDILLDKEGRIITENQAFFEEGLSNLSTEMYSYLNEIWEYYKYNPKDKIRVLTRASFQEASMNRAETEKLAVSRANATKSYLMSKGINDNNIEIEVHVFNEKNEKRQQALRQLQIFLTR